MTQTSIAHVHTVENMIWAATSISYFKSNEIFMQVVYSKVKAFLHHNNTVLKHFGISLQLNDPKDDQTLMTLNLFLKDRMERRATLLTDLANRRMCILCTIS